MLFDVIAIPSAARAMKQLSDLVNRPSSIERRTPSLVERHDRGEIIATVVSIEYLRELMENFCIEFVRLLEDAAKPLFRPFPLIFGLCYHQGIRSRLGEIEGLKCSHFD